ncbi:hypothetical protein [Anabaena azotica]|uniref:Uncharacterized protein n=1 Tax=Anabaena azotica FACHB-119 TaxID=947527 RepID=A0ABR8D7P9_9NOST|nr:hypothetical protein [Anabaena azotica]MBD2503208.1 hypothetical protein [Anabaena azotica FACHB-119]
MSDLPEINLSDLNLDQTTLKAIEKLVNSIEDLLNNKPDDVSRFLYKVNEEVRKLKYQKGTSDTNLIHASTRDLKKAFYAHRGIVTVEKNKSISCYLLTFYAVECGFKSIWLKRNQLTGTDKIQDKTLITKDGHNFRTWFKELGLPATIVGKYPDFSKIPYFRLARDQSSWDVGKAHQAWRYGVEMDIDDEKLLVEWLNSICNWIKEAL